MAPRRRRPQQQVSSDSADHQRSELIRAIKGLLRSEDALAEALDAGDDENHLKEREDEIDSDRDKLAIAIREFLNRPAFQITNQPLTNQPLALDDNTLALLRRICLEPSEKTYEKLLTTIELKPLDIELDAQAAQRATCWRPKQIIRKYR